jgi:hypothetical protein
MVNVKTWFLVPADFAFNPQILGKHLFFLAKYTWNTIMICSRPMQNVSSSFIADHLTSLVCDGLFCYHRMIEWCSSWVKFGPLLCSPPNRIAVSHFVHPIVCNPCSDYSLEQLEVFDLSCVHYRNCLHWWFKHICWNVHVLLTCLSKWFQSDFLSPYTLPDQLYHTSTIAILQCPSNEG